MKRSVINFDLILKCSNYFYRTAGLLDVLQNLGINQEIIDAIQNLPTEKQQHWVAALRKNPALSLEELNNLPSKEKKNYNSTTEDYEKRIIGGSHEFNSWGLIQLKKIRNRKELPEGFLRSILAGDHPTDQAQIESWLKQNNLSMNLIGYVDFISQLDEIGDWYKATHPQLASYTAAQAIEASFLWHQEQASEGESKVYKEGNSGIVYGPSWQNSSWKGWTIRKIKTKNDLQVEGNLMNHCVGSYCENVELGDTDIYSLRDPSNMPHVTMETNGGGFNFNQIQGKSNFNPKPEYKAMIKEWVGTLDGAQGNDFHLDLYNIEYAEDPLLYIENQLTNEYGFIDPNSNIIYIFNNLNELILTNLHNRFKVNNNECKKFAKFILEHAIKHDLNNIKTSKTPAQFLHNSALFSLHLKYSKFYEEGAKENIERLVYRGMTREIQPDEVCEYLFTEMVNEARRNQDLQNLLKEISLKIPQFSDLIPLFKV